MGVHNCSGTEVLSISPEHRAAGGASRTQDALGGVIKTSAFLGRLQALFFWLVACNQEWVDVAVGLVERLHVNYKVLLNGQTLDWLNVDRLGDI